MDPTSKRFSQMDNAQNVRTNTHNCNPVSTLENVRLKGRPSRQDTSSNADLNRVNTMHDLSTRVESD